MKYLLSFNLLFAALLWNGFSQSNFLPGYVVMNNNDTLYGYVDLRSNSRNSRICHFREDFQRRPVTFLPGEILSYRYLDNKYYVSKEILLNDKRSIFFLEYLFDGIVSVYYLNTSNVEYYFIEKNDGVLHLLQNEQISRNVSGKGKVTYETKRYKGQLRYLLADHPDLSPKIDESKLSQGYLVSIARDYHDFICPDESCSSFENKLPLIAPKFLGYVGLTKTKINFLRNRTLSLVDMGTSYSSSFGLTFDFNFPRISQTITMPISFEFGRYYHHGYIEGTGLLADRSMEYHDFHFRSIHLNIVYAIKYSFPSGVIRPFFSVGFITNRNSSGYLKRVSDYKNDNIIISEEDTTYNLYNFMGGFRFSSGFTLHLKKQLSPFVNLSYDRMTSSINFTESYNTFTNFQTRTLNLHIGFNF